tara:strand:+ start:210 stop:383 length:174 start_codon:yes stop_codon:yes gene_type:complete
MVETEVLAQAEDLVLHAVTMPLGVVEEIKALAHTRVQPVPLEEQEVEEELNFSLLIA